MKLARVVIAAAAPLFAQACATQHSNLPSGAAAYEVIPPTPAKPNLIPYLVRPADQLTVIVFREPDLSLTGIEVDTEGRLAMPLIGHVVASGKTTEEIATSITEELSRYLVDPKVTVFVASSVGQRVIVDGAVVQRGVYEFRGTTTLLGALSLARGPSEVAALDEVAILRVIDGRLHGARFDIRAIRLGNAPDPQVLPNDTVVVGFSNLKGAWRDILRAIPAIALFRPF